MSAKPRNPLLQKRALDALLEMIGDPDYATHQHHSDPGFTTQNGKDYAGRNTTEPESGALKDGIPASLLSVELGKQAKAPAGYIGPLYHGTFGGFDKFSLPEDVEYEEHEGLGIHFGTMDQAEARVGYQEGTNIIPVYLKVKKPLRMPDMGMWDPEEVSSRLLQKRIIKPEQHKQIVALSGSPEGIDYTACYKLLRQWLDARGYDAVVYKNTVEGSGDSYMVWHPEQIKSAEKARGKHADFLPHDPSIPTVRKPLKSYNPTGDTPTTSDEYRECVNCGQGFDVDPRRKGDMCSKCMREAYPRYYASVNPYVTPIPSAPTEPDPDTVTFHKESLPQGETYTPAEEKIIDAVEGAGFQYGARVDDGKTLWFRGRDERLSFNPKDGMVTYLVTGSPVWSCHVDELKSRMGEIAKSAAQIFHETLKKALGQDKEAAIRPSPSKVFEEKIDKSTGQNPPAPKNPDDSDVEEAKQTLENAGQPVGNQIGVNAGSKWGDKLKKMRARREESKTAEEQSAQATGPCTVCNCREFIQKVKKAGRTMNPEELGTQASGFSGGGPFTCMNCVWRTPHSTDENGEEVDSCRHPKVMADPELEDRKLPDGTIKVDYDDCCRFVRPPKEKS